MNRPHLANGIHFLCEPGGFRREIYDVVRVVGLGLLQSDLITLAERGVLGEHMRWYAIRPKDVVRTGLE